MKSVLVPLAGAGLAVLVLAGAAAAADADRPVSNWATPVPVTTPAPAVTPAPAATPAPPDGSAAAPVPAADEVPVASTAPATTGMLSAILGLTDAEVQAMRVQGKSLADIAVQQKVDPQKLIDALVAVWGARVDARLTAGAITADQAATLKAGLVAQATAMVNQTTPGGMGGGAVGAGPNGTMGGRMGAGRMGAGQANGGRMDAGQMGAGRGGAMRGQMGAGAGNGSCPVVDGTTAG